MKRFIALFLACLCLFTLVGCKDKENDAEPELTDYQKIVKYIEENGGFVVVETNDVEGKITISNPGNIIRIKQEPNWSDDICAGSTLDLKENENYYNYKGTYSNSSGTFFTVEGKIEASTYKDTATLTYTSKTGDSVHSTSLRIINLMMARGLKAARNNIYRATDVDIYALFNFDQLVY